MKAKLIIFYKSIYKKVIYFKIYSFLLFISILLNFPKKKIGVIGLEHSINIGNNLLKYAISITLSNLGFDPYIVGKRFHNQNISFIQSVTKIRLINNSFSEIKENDYDILMVNSDQTWRKWSNKYNYFYDIAFLKFAEKWNKVKFVYGASLGKNVWNYNKSDEKIAKYLLKDFNGISVREKGAINLIKKHLGITPYLVLDPTLLIDKQYYLNLIKNYKPKIYINDSYIFVYTVGNFKEVKSFIKRINIIYKNKIFWVKSNIKDFIYGIYYCKAIVTNSFHGTVFSILFNKPFITFLNENGGIERFNSLKEIFDIGKRLYYKSSKPKISLLEKPLNLNMNIFYSLKKESIKFLIRNLKSHKNKKL